MSQITRVALLMCLYSEYDRGLVSGIGQYASLQGPWVFHLAGEDQGVPYPENEAMSTVIVDVAQSANLHPL